MSVHRKTSAAGTQNIFARSGTQYLVTCTMDLLITHGRFCLLRTRRYSARANAVLIFAQCASITRERLELVIKTPKPPYCRRRSQSRLVTATEHWAVTAMVQFM